MIFHISVVTVIHESPPQKCGTRRRDITEMDLPQTYRASPKYLIAPTASTPHQLAAFQSKSRSTGTHPHVRTVRNLHRRRL